MSEAADHYFSVNVLVYKVLLASKEPRNSKPLFFDSITECGGVRDTLIKIDLPARLCPGASQPKSGDVIIPTASAVLAKHKTDCAVSGDRGQTSPSS